jgi:hypothetical protein
MILPRLFWSNWHFLQNFKRIGAQISFLFLRNFLSSFHPAGIALASTQAG